jgi:hypothetical protein
MTGEKSKYSEDKCFCNDIDELMGNDVQDYCTNHLKQVAVNGESWQITYICPETDIQWLEDYPNSEYHGGGSPRLRKLSLPHENL